MKWTWPRGKLLRPEAALAAIDLADSPLAGIGWLPFRLLPCLGRVIVCQFEILNKIQWDKKQNRANIGQKRPIALQTDQLPLEHRQVYF